MRIILEDPTGQSKLVAPVTLLAEKIYSAHESGQPYDTLLAELGALVGKSVTSFEVHSAFGSVKPATFAQGLLVNVESVPTDLSREEMLEIIQRLLEARHNELQPSFWLKCLVANTKDQKISDLLYWPGEYFGDGNNRREMSADEILQTALNHGAHSNGT